MFSFIPDKDTDAS